MDCEQSDMPFSDHTSKTSHMTFHGQPYAEDPVQNSKALNDGGDTI